MVDTATTKAVPAAAAHATRQGYWRGVLRRLLRDPGGVVVGVDVPAPETHRQRWLPAGLG